MTGLLPPPSALAGLLPLAALGLAVAAFRRRDPGGGAAGAVVRGAAAWGATVVAASEAAGLFGALGRPVLAAFWIAAACAAAVAFARAPRPPAPAADAPARTARRLLPFLAVAPLLLLAAAVAVLYPENTYDSMTYHLARIELWLQHGSPAFFPTPTERQLCSQPFAELAALQIHALAGGDWFDGFVQWLALAGGLVVVRDLALRASGGDRAAAGFAVVFAGTLPIALAEASTVQNDLVAGFWLLASCHALSDVLRRGGVRGGVLFGTAAGLGILSKGTCYPALLPVLAAFGIHALRSFRARWRCAAAAGAAVLLVNATHWGRCIAWFGDPFGGQAARFPPPMTAKGLFVTAYGNVLSNVAAFAPSFFRRASAWLLGRLGVAPDDAAYFHPSSDMLAVATPGRVFSQDFAPNPLHALLLAAAAVLVAARWRRLSRDARIFAAVLAGGCALFVFSVRWQIWITRLQIPFFLLGAVLAGLLLARLPRAAALAVAALLVAGGVPFAACVQYRSLVPTRIAKRTCWEASCREELYFASCPEEYAAFAAACADVAASGADEVEVVCRNDAWVYPLFPILRASGAKVPRFSFPEEPGARGPAVPVLEYARTGPRGRPVLRR